VAKDYRPISLCNACYKVMSKLHVNRMKKVLHRVVSEEQSAFIYDRLIMDNVLLAHKVLHSMGSRIEGKNLMHSNWIWRGHMI